MWLWRWCNLCFSAISFFLTLFDACSEKLLTLLTLPETYPPLLLLKKARRVRKETGDGGYKASIELVKVERKIRLNKTLLKPRRCAMTRYLKIDWTEAKSLKDPVVFYHKIGDNQCEKRRVEVFADGKFGHSSLIEPENTTSLSWEPFADLEEIHSPEFCVHEITHEEFESVWARALGEAPPDRPDEYLPQWFTANRERLQGPGLDERISASNVADSSSKRSVKIDLDSLERVGRVTLLVHRGSRP